MGAVAIVAAAVLVFDRSYLAYRQSMAAAPDNLIYYTMLSRWWHHGDSPVGYTLLPSPYFVDLAIQLPIALLAPDFEVFSYGLALTFYLLVTGAVALVWRAWTGSSWLAATLAAAVTMSLYVGCVPTVVHVHLFWQSHTSELFGSLLALWFVLSRVRAMEDERVGWPVPLLTLVGFTIWTFIQVASSPFFGATFAVPLVVTALASFLLPRRDHHRALLQFGLATVVGSLLGLVFDAVLSWGRWPIRGDIYFVGVGDSARALVGVASALPLISSVIVLVGALCIATLAVARRRRPWFVASTEHASSMWIVAAYTVSVCIACVSVPVFRRAFQSSYELRYVQLPCILSLSVLVNVVRLLVGRLRKAFMPPVSLGSTVWRTLAISSVVVAWTAAGRIRGPFGMENSDSLTSEALACFRDAERTHGLKDGIATSTVARILNAARQGKGWRSSNLVIEMQSWFPPSVQSQLNNALWFQRADRATDLNFVVADGFSEESLAFLRERIGPVARRLRCPPLKQHVTEPVSSLEILIFEELAARRALTRFVRLDPMAQPLVPAVRRSNLALDRQWGLYSPEGGGRVSAEGRIWEHSPEKGVSAAIRTRPMFLPSGSYRATLVYSLETREDGDDTPPEFSAWLTGKQLAGTTLAAIERSATLDFDVTNRGGPTSGDSFALVMSPGNATRILVRDLLIERLEEPGPDWLRLFR